MPTHWTYDHFETEEDLRQGDILEPSTSLRDVLREVHPHFLDPKYTAFLITTQTCDLVRRGKPRTCSTGYVNIVVVRSIEDVLHDLISHRCKPVASQIYLQEKKGDARDLLHRIFNQNEQALGLFYLHNDADAGIAVPSVALLRVGVTLKVDHYDVLRQARIGRVASAFTAKLGWLVGNLYSRVGTPDWSESAARTQQLDLLIDATLREDDRDHAPVWVQQALVTAARNAGVDLALCPKGEVKAVLEMHRLPPAKEQIIERVVNVLREVTDSISDEQMKAVANRLRNDQFFATAIKSAKQE